MKRTILRSAMVVLSCFFMITLSFPQIREAGIIHGNVQDEQGEALPGATVTVSGPNLIGGAKTYITDQNGYYRFPSLPPGPYTVSAELPGFVKVVREVIRLHANMTLTVDFKMAQAKVKEEVVVIAKTPTVDIKSSAKAPTIMTEELIMSLPVAKDFSDLMGLAAGIEMEPGSNIKPAYGMGYGYSNAYQFDGIDVSSARSGDMLFSPDFNTIQEATILGIGLPAEFGGYTGAVLMGITKSGANKFSTLEEFWYNGRKWNSQNLGNYPEERFSDPADKEKEFEAGSYLDFGAQFGGKIIQDRLWFFLSGEYTGTKNYPLGTPSIQEGTNLKGFLKLTYQLNPFLRLNFSSSYDNEEMKNAFASPLLSPEADVNGSSPGWSFNLNLTSILSPNTILEVKLGYSHKKIYYDPVSGTDLASHYDLGTGVSSGNNSTWTRDKDRTFHGGVHFSHYFPQLIKGSHDVKVGAEIVYAAPITATGVTGGGVMYYDLYGQPLQRVVQTPAYSERNHYYSNSTVFVRDSWVLTKRLTLNLGLRYAHYRYRIPSPERGVILSTGSFSPRLGFTFDILGDRKNVLKFHYGHYHEKLYPMFYNLTDTRLPAYATYMWTGTDWMFAYEYKPDPSTGTQVDPNTKQPYIREISAGFERELFRDASLSINFYYRKIARFLGLANTTGQWKKVTIVNPGFDGIPGTSDDLGTLDVYEQLNPGQDRMLVTNPEKGQYEAMVDDPKYTSTGLEILFHKRYANRWQVIASYHYSRVRGNTDFGLTSLGYDPNNFVNSYGERGYMYGQPHQFKLQGNVLLPWDIDLGVVAQYSSGAVKGANFYAMVGYQSKLISIVPPGEYKYAPKTNLDLRVQKHFDVGKGKLSLIADIFNLFNSDRVLSSVTQVGVNYDKIVTVTRPRTFRMGFRFTY